MIKLIFSDGTEKAVSYNEAAKVYQILQGNELVVTPQERSKYIKLAEKTKRVEFNKPKKGNY